MSSNSMPSGTDTQVTCPNCQVVFSANVSHTEGGAEPVWSERSATTIMGSESLTPAPAPPGVPRRIGRFEIRRFVGEGVFGRVYEAYDPLLKRRVALKAARPEQLTTENRIRRFQREAQNAALLLHPHIVAIFDSGQDGAQYYIASAFIEGKPLDAVLKGQALPLRQAVAIVRKLAEALAYAHKQGVIHRDLKPANVMLRSDGEPLVMDFGMAARSDELEKLTQDGSVMGTPTYMAPEQWKGKAEPASDQYSLGVMLFELLTGRLPFVGTSTVHCMFLHCNEPVPALRSLRRDLPRDLDTICRKCLGKEPDQRYADCQQLADDLRRFLDGEPVSVRPPGPGERLVKWARRNPAVAALTAAVALALVLGATVASYFAVRAQANAAEAEREKDLRAPRSRRPRRMPGGRIMRPPRQSRSGTVPTTKPARPTSARTTPGRAPSWPRRKKPLPSSSAIERSSRSM